MKVSEAKKILDALDDNDEVKLEIIRKGGSRPNDRPSGGSSQADSSPVNDR